MSERTFYGGCQSGRSEAVRQEIVLRAANPDEARALLQDLRDSGVALMDDSGRRVERRRRAAPPRVFWDEGKILE